MCKKTVACMKALIYIIGSKTDDNYRNITSKYTTMINSLYPPSNGWTHQTTRHDITVRTTKNWKPHLNSFYTLNLTRNFYKTINTSNCILRVCATLGLT
jgi:hypothetical protein